MQDRAADERVRRQGRRAPLVRRARDGRGGGQLNAEKLEQRSKGVLSHKKDRIMQELNEKRALRLEQSRMLVAYGNVQ